MVIYYGIKVTPMKMMKSSERAKGVIDTIVIEERE